MLRFDTSYIIVVMHSGKLLKNDKDFVKFPDFIKKIAQRKMVMLMMFFWSVVIRKKYVNDTQP